MEYIIANSERQSEFAMFVAELSHINGLAGDPAQGYRNRVHWSRWEILFNFPLSRADPLAAFLSRADPLAAFQGQTPLPPFEQEIVFSFA